MVIISLFLVPFVFFFVLVFFYRFFIVFFCDCRRLLSCANNNIEFDWVEVD